MPGAMVIGLNAMAYLLIDRARPAGRGEANLEKKPSYARFGELMIARVARRFYRGIARSATNFK